MASNVGNSVPQIAAMWMTDERHVRRVIDEFNERGMASLDPDYRGGRPRRITDEQRRQAVAVAGARPDSQGVALTRWSAVCSVAGVTFTARAGAGRAPEAAGAAA